jgi:hypothetical protein
MHLNRRLFLQGSALTALASTLSSAHPLDAVAGLPSPTTESGWWTTQPIRWVHPNLRETDAALNPKQFVATVADLNANVLITAMAGISASYPSKVQGEYISPYMPKDQDTFGDVLREAHARNIRVGGRCDFSKAHKDVYDAHPEWFFRMANGQPSIYNGLYQTCINGGWYREKSVEILTEALGRYDVDAVYFNMFSNPAADYSGHPIGLCHCDNCERLYQERFHRNVPDTPDADYHAFLHGAGESMSITIRSLVKAKRPKAAFIGAAPQICDIVYSESNTGVYRPLPLWPYSASINTNQWRNNYPDKAAVNQCMSFLDFRWRFSPVAQPEIRSRIWQGIANGGGAALSLHGTIAGQPDRTAIDVVRPMYAWLKEHEDYFVGQTSEARVVLLAPRPDGVGLQISQDAYHGLVRLLTEQHIPFAAMESLDWLGKRDADLVISPGQTPAALQTYVQNGGRLILASATAPEFELAPTVKIWKSPDGAYFRIRDKALFPSLKETDVVFMYGDYLQVHEANAPITFIPPAMYGPPELVDVDWKDTDDPGLVMKNWGRGKVAWLPWDIGGLYFRHSSEAHSRLLSDLIDAMLPDGRQLESNAHPLVEITFMRQNNRNLMHFINLTGHSDTAYFNPVPITNIRVKVKRTFHSARAIRSGVNIDVKNEDGFAEFTLPELDEYELVELR